jgi:ABC-2 type transport system ATP-binding protein
MVNKEVISAKNLTKFYGKKRGIIDVALSVFRGEIFGYLGPNGAGKTTTIRIFMDFIRADKGRALLFDLDSRLESQLIRKRVGYLPGELSLYGNLTSGQFLRFFANLRNSNNWKFVEELADRLKCNLSLPIKTLSHGNKQKVGVIQALMHKPELLILDEPTNGLDPLVQLEFYHLINEFKMQGCTIFLSSHNLPEVERICDRVGIIRKGKIVDIEPVADLKKRSVRNVEVIFTKPANKDILTGIKNVSNLNIEGNRLKCQVIGDMDPVIKRISEQNVLDFISHQPGLEEVFLAFYGETNNAF